MGRLAVLAGAALLSCSSACGWIEKDKAVSRRRAVEKRVVEVAESADLVDLKSFLEEDPTLANSFRWTSDAKGHDPFSIQHSVKSSRFLRTDTALTAALKARRLTAVELLLSSGADPNLSVDSEEVPLDILAVSKQRDETATALGRLLLSHGARLGPRTGKDGVQRTPLQVLLDAGAVKDDQDGLLRLYVSDSSALGATDFRGLAALHEAAWTCQDRAVEVLLEAGADPIARSVHSGAARSTQRTGDTPLHRAADCGRIGVVFALCAGGANPRLTNEAGETPLAAFRRIAAAHPDGSSTQAEPRRSESVAAALSPDGPCGTWYGRFLRDGRPATWGEVRAARYEFGCALGARSDCGDAGWAFDKGEGVPVDFAKAMAAYRKACDLKGAWACGMVGILHENGEGVAKDPAEAARWFGMGCDGNDGQSCSRLAGLARDGRGVAQDRTRALALFDKACAEKYQKGCEGARALR